MTLLILFALFAAFGVCTLRAFFLFDTILQKEYSDHPEAWKADGMPIGFLWVPKEGKVVAGSVARSGLVMQWALSLPQWAESQADLIPLFAKLKRSAIAGLCVWGVSMVVLLTFPK